MTDCTVSVAEQYSEQRVRSDDVVELASAVEYAELSCHVYAYGTCPTMPSGWSVIEDVKILTFHARAYQKGDEIVIAFEGTHSYADVQQQLQEAVDVRQQISEQLVRDVITGLELQIDMGVEGVANLGQDGIEAKQDFARNVHDLTAMLKLGDTKGAWQILKSAKVDLQNRTTTFGENIISAIKEYGQDVRGGFQYLVDDLSEINTEYGNAAKADLDFLLDWAEGNLIGTIHESIQERFAKYFTNSVIENHSASKYVVTGHSMGGKLAQVVLLENASIEAAYTFNSAPLGKEALESAISNPSNYARSVSNVIAVREGGDPLQPLAPLNLGDYVSIDFQKQGQNNHSIRSMASNLRMINNAFNEQCASGETNPTNAPVNIGQAIAAAQDQREFPGFSLVSDEFSERFDPFDRFIYLHRFQQNKLSIVLALQEMLPYFRDSSDVTMTNQDRLSAVEDAILVIANHIGLSLEDFKLFSDGRNMYQSPSIAYPELTPENGWVLLPEEKSAFHMIGLDGGSIEKWVNEGRKRIRIFHYRR